MNGAEVRREAHARELDGRRAWDEGDLGRADRNFREALAGFSLLEDTPGAGRILVTLARLNLAEGESRMAVELSRQAVSRTPGDADALTVLGYAQWAGGSPADAEVTFGQALYNDRTAVRALAGRGQVRADMSDYLRALNDLDQAIELGVPAEDEPDVRSARALALAGLGKFAEAADEISAVLEENPTHHRAVLRAGWIALLQGRPGEFSQDITELQNSEDLSMARSAGRLLTRYREAVSSE